VFRVQNARRRTQSEQNAHTKTPPNTRPKPPPPRTVLVKADRRDRAPVAVKGNQGRRPAAGHIKHAHVRVARCGDERLVGRDLEAVDLRVGVLERAVADARGRLPEAAGLGGQSGSERRAAAAAAGAGGGQGRAPDRVVVARGGENDRGSHLGRNAARRGTARKARWARARRAGAFRAAAHSRARAPPARGGSRGARHLGVIDWRAAAASALMPSPPPLSPPPPRPTPLCLSLPLALSAFAVREGPLHKRARTRHRGEQGTSRASEVLLRRRQKELSPRAAPDGRRPRRAARTAASKERACAPSQRPLRALRAGCGASSRPRRPRPRRAPPRCGAAGCTSRGARSGRARPS
jgi:hypothetical protein